MKKHQIKITTFKRKDKKKLSLKDFKWSDADLDALKYIQ